MKRTTWRLGRGRTWAALLLTLGATAQSALGALSYDIPAPTLSYYSWWSAGMGCCGPHGNPAHEGYSVGMAPLPGQIYGNDHHDQQSDAYSYSDEMGGGESHGTFDLRASSTHRAAFGDLGVALRAVTSGSGQTNYYGVAGAGIFPLSAESHAMAGTTAGDSFVVGSSSLITGTPVTVDFGAVLGGGLNGAYHDEGYLDIWSTEARLGVSRSVAVYRGGAVDPVFSQARTEAFAVGGYEQPTTLDLFARLPWQLTLQVGDVVDFRVTLYADVVSSISSVSFSTEGSVTSMNSLHPYFLPGDPLQVQLQFASGYDYTLAAALPVPEPPPAGLWLLGLAALARWRRSAARAQRSDRAGR